MITWAHCSGAMRLRSPVAARELLPPDLALELELRQTELKLAAVQATLRGLEA